MTKSEHQIQSEIMLHASNLRWVVFRNNVGVGWQGDATRLADGSILIRNPRPLHAGLCTGSSDLIGWRPILVGPEHLGATIAQFCGIEVKTPKGRESKEQAHFRGVVNCAGGLVILARGPGDLGGVE
jgi:hypothetical protein